jgi:gluconolactonase
MNATRSTLVAVTLGLIACGGGGSGGAGSGGAAPASGGAGGGGGTVGSGGAISSGGSGGSPTGGSTSSGGATSPGSGGATATGGAAGQGGSGTLATGGSVPLATGGSATGGRTGTGGSATGGVPATGGTTGGAGGTGTGGDAGGRRAGACQPGVSYPAPVLTGTVKQVAKAAAGGSGTYEGPVWVSAGAFLLHSDITFTSPVNPSQILKLTPPSTVATFLADAGVNGMAADGSGAIFACSHKLQGIVKLDLAAASLTPVVDQVGGKKFNSPNDLVIRSDGTLFFTDPDYQLGNRTSETGKKGVYRVNPTGAVSVVDDTFAQPNGITLSPDEKVLYVADYAANAVRTFAVAADGSTSARKDFVTVASPDGFGMDCLGNLYVASGGSGGALQVFAPSGSKLGSVPVAASLSNVAFGGPDGKTLYLTAGKALYSLDMNLPGYFD